MLQKKNLPRVLLILYGALMLWLLFFQTIRIPDYSAALYWQRVGDNLNLVPFRTVGNYLHILLHREYYLDKWDAGRYAFQARQAIINLGGNVGMFLPLGFLLPWVFRKLQRLWKTLLATVAIISLVEVLQLFSLLGSCDIDDLILNALGAAIGYFLWYALMRKKNWDA